MIMLFYFINFSFLNLIMVLHELNHVLDFYELVIWRRYVICECYLHSLDVNWLHYHYFQLMIVIVEYIFCWEHSKLHYMLYYFLIKTVTNTHTSIIKVYLSFPSMSFSLFFIFATSSFNFKFCSYGISSLAL